MRNLLLNRWLASQTKKISIGKSNQCAAIAAECCLAFTHVHVCAPKACTIGILAESIILDAISKLTKIAIAPLSYNKFKMPSKDF